MATRLRLGGLVEVGKSNRSSSFPPAIEAEALLGMEEGDICGHHRPPSHFFLLHPATFSTARLPSHFLFPPPSASGRSKRKIGEGGGRESANSRLPSSSRLGVKSDEMKRPDLIPTFFLPFAAFRLCSVGECVTSRSFPLSFRGGLPGMRIYSPGLFKGKASY